MPITYKAYLNRKIYGTKKDKALYFYMIYHHILPPLTRKEISRLIQNGKSPKSYTVFDYFGENQ